jgi:hypothetical protein
MFDYKGKGKGEVHHRTVHEVPERGWRYSSTLHLTSAQDGVGVKHHAPESLLPGKSPGTHSIGGWVGPRAGLDGCGKTRPTWIRSPDRPTHSQSLYLLRYPGPRLITNLKL